jgi:hypothetical protein
MLVVAEGKYPPNRRVAPRRHLANDPFSFGHVDEHKPHVRPVEGRAPQPCVICVSLADLNLCQRVAGDEAARQRDKMLAPFNAKN